MPKNSSRFFRNTECEYFPCHDNVDTGNFNCLFCFCPLHSVINCGGQYRIAKNGIKDCSKCGYPHRPENYDDIIKKVGKLLHIISFPESGTRI